MFSLRPAVDIKRNDAVHARVGARSSAAVGAALSDTATDVVWILGIGFGLYILFGSVLPALFGAAAKTKHSYKELRGHRSSHHHEHKKLPGHTPSDWDEYLASSEGQRKSRSSIIDAEFETIPPSPPRRFDEMVYSKD